MTFGHRTTGMVHFQVFYTANSGRSFLTMYLTLCELSLVSWLPYLSYYQALCIVPYTARLWAYTTPHGHMLALHEKKTSQVWDLNSILLA
jgi:hypothetical protein